jgi:hypothetical protein
MAAKKRQKRRPKTPRKNDKKTAKFLFSFLNKKNIFCRFLKRYFLSFFEKTFFAAFICRLRRV